MTRAIHELGRLRVLWALVVSLTALPAFAGIWMDDERLARLPTSGNAWERLLMEADQDADTPDLADQEDPTNVRVFAKALVYARTGIERYRQEVIEACMAAIGTEGGRTLALGRELMAYVLAADLVSLPPDEDQRFRAWLATLPDRSIDGRTLRSTHEDRPNNWGTHAGASRLAVAIYLDDSEEMARSAQVFRGWLGDRNAYAGFTYGNLDWQCDGQRPVGINPLGCTRNGHSIDGALPEELRRAGGFVWLPPQENYVYEGLQGAIAQAVMLSRLGHDVWNWEDRALLRAYRWLYEQADFPAEGDDQWQIHLVNFFYGVDFPATAQTSPGKNVGWTEWTHGNAPTSPVIAEPAPAGPSSEPSPAANGLLLAPILIDVYRGS
jgi:hypothetical protein